MCSKHKINIIRHHKNKRPPQKKTSYFTFSRIICKPNKGFLYVFLYRKKNDVVSCKVKSRQRFTSQPIMLDDACNLSAVWSLFYSYTTQCTTTTTTNDDNDDTNNDKGLP